MFVLFHGPDEFTAREELSALRASHDFAFNQDTFAGGETGLDVILATCDTLPFLSEHRLVVVEGLPRRKRAAKGGGTGEDAALDGDDTDTPAAPAASGGAKAASRGKKGKAGSGPDPRAFAQGIADHVPLLPPSTVLVVLVDEQLDSANPLVRAAEQHGRVRACLPPRGAQLQEWLIRRSKARDVRLDHDAAQMLASEIGDNLRLLASELDKLSTYVGPGGRIRTDEVRLLTPASRQARVFDLTDALARRDRSRALALLHELLESGESPLGIVALTAYQTRALLQVKTLGERGLRVPQIAQAAGMAPFVVEKSLALARQFSFAQLEAAHRTLLEVDTALKRSRMTPDMALDLLVIEFGANTP